MMSTQTTTTLPSTLHTTATSSANASDIIVEMGYVKENPDGTAPSFSQLHEWHPDSLDLRNVVIRDVRDKQDGVPELDKNGFEYFDMEFNEDIDYADDEDVKAKWYPRIEEVLKERLNANQVTTFNHIVRNAVHDRSIPMAASYKGPAVRPHLDISSLFAPTVLRDKASSNPPIIPASLVDQYLRTTSTATVDPTTNAVTVTTVTAPAGPRWQILNVWRPLSTVRRDPFAVVDAASMRDRDWIHLQLPHHGFGDNASAKTGFLRAPVEGSGKDAEEREEGRKHEWWYCKEQTREEVLLFRQYDSEGRVGLPHSAFRLPQQDDALPPRQSIETRLFVFY